MNWKTEAAEKLRRYDAMQASLENLPQEIARLRMDASAIRSARSDAATVLGGGNRREDALLNNLMHREELQQLYRQAKQWIKTTDRALGALKPEEKLILYRLYMHPEAGAMDRLCQELAVEKSSIYRRRDQALERFTLALYGTLEQ